MAPTQETHLRLENATFTDIINTKVYSVDNHDWDKDSGPHRTFNGKSIPAGQSLSRRQEVKRFAKNCPFSMTVFFSDGSKDSFRIYQKFALGNRGNKGWTHWDVHHNVWSWREGNKTIVIKFENTPAQISNHEAEQRHTEARNKLAQKRYQEALRLCEEALRKATQSATKNSINSTKTSINSAVAEEAAVAKAQKLHSEAQKLLDEALKLEAQGRAIEAEKKFNEAEAKVQESIKVKKTAAAEKTLKTITLKIEANRLYNEATKEEMEAIVLFQKIKEDGTLHNCNPVQEKYRQAVAKYREALKKFEEAAKLGGAKYTECANLVKNDIVVLTKVIHNLDRIELNQSFSQVRFTEEKIEGNEESQVNTNILQQVGA